MHANAPIDLLPHRFSLVVTATSCGKRELGSTLRAKRSANRLISPALSA
jgi:hypothetical protein